VLIHPGFHGQVDQCRTLLAADAHPPSPGERRHRRRRCGCGCFHQVELREAEQRAFDLFLQNLVKGTSHLSLARKRSRPDLQTRMKPGDLSSAPTGAMRTTLARGVPVEKC